MKEFFADLHIHIGWTENKKPVKITASKNLTFKHILHESFEKKGLHLIGIIDGHSPAVQDEITHYINQGLIVEDNNGGLKYKELSILLGTEVEIKEENRGAAHYLVFLPTLSDMKSFTKWMSKYMRNVQLSSQRLYVSTRDLQKEIKNREGLFIPAHIFTPFKSVFGSCCNRMDEVMDLSLIDAVELGLSSDTEMASQIADLDYFPFLTNSDAHSLPKIGREYNKLRLDNPNFKEFAMALKQLKGREITSNYGLDPKLGKYFNSRCFKCDSEVDGNVCANCGSTRIIRGVSNRIKELAVLDKHKKTIKRVPYIHQVPLEFIPKLGPKTLQKLLDAFGTEMNIFHKATKTELKKIVSDEITELILKGRKGELLIQKGGGGIYGKVLK